MKIYLDLVILLNFFIDYLLLATVSIILKRNTKIIRLIIGSLFGGLSILSLFITLSSINLFMLKIIISIIMTLISFGYKNIKYTINNLVYLYLISIILGGGLYLINNQLSYKTYGLIFVNNGLSINIILIILFSPLVIYSYIKTTKKLKEEYSRYYKVEITFLNNKKINITGFLDTGNNLIDPYQKRPILVLNKYMLKDYNPRCILVPIKTINKESILKCFKIKKLVIDKKIIKKDVLIGISDNNFNMEDVNILLNKKIIKGE